MAKKAIKKSNKKSTDQVDFNNSYQAIKDTASSINGQLVEAAKIVADDVLSAGKQLGGDVYKMAAESINGINVDNSIETIKSNVKHVNDFTIDTAEDLVEGALKNGEQVQEIAAKAIQDGLKLAAKQQEIIFDTLDAVKKQVAKNTVRLIDIFS